MTPMDTAMSLAEIFRVIALNPEGVRIEAFDGSRSGPPDASAVIRVKDDRAVRYLMRAPGDLGLARAYVSGSLDVDGDLHHAIVAMVLRRVGGIPWNDLRPLLPATKDLLPYLRHQPPLPAVEAPSRWRRGLRHSKGRDAEAIHHHYDVSNKFYEYVLGPSMTYTCGVYPTADASLEEAQAAKYDLVCRKLDLQPGMRLLDVGCGWGGMVMHAVEHYGVTALGVTLSRQQAEWAGKAIAERGLSDRAEVRHQDYREVPNSSYDAISSIGLTEHIGKRNVPAYFDSLYTKLRPQGRLLNHCITRPRPGMRATASGFIDRYVFPDGELESPGYLVEQMNRAGFEVRHEENIREHYAMTLRDWGANLERRWDDAVAEVGLQKARVWRLYMAASRAGFDCDMIELHQILGVRTATTAHDVTSGFPLRPSFS
jgi:cyclopropane-fatty-acyl-phospholipid synthase